MKQYRKSNAYYEQQYDEMIEVKTKFIHSSYDKLDKHEQIYVPHILSDFKNKRDETIRKWINDDERKDILIQAEPNIDVFCSKCNSKMYISNHIFKNNNNTVLFVYDCRNKHFPRRAFYNNGEEYYFEELRCTKCNGELISTTKEYKNKLIFTDTCKDCGNITTETIGDYDISYGINDIKQSVRNLLIKNINEFNDVMDSIPEARKEKNLRKKYKLDDIKITTVPRLENLLKTAIEKQDYIKLNFDSIETKKHVIISFSVQDPTERNNDESPKKLQKLIKRVLLHHNWRLMSDGISYRLGILTGRLKAYETEDDLIIIGNDIIKRTK